MFTTIFFFWVACAIVAIIIGVRKGRTVEGVGFGLFLGPIGIICILAYPTADYWSPPTRTTEPKKVEQKARKAGAARPLIAVGLAMVAVFFLTGFFVIQPIGAIPSGVTVWYVRAGTSLKFIDSADGIAIRQDGSVSLMSRSAYMAAASKYVIGRKIVRLPYFDLFYIISTGGRRFDQ